MGRVNAGFVDNPFPSGLARIGAGETRMKRMGLRCVSSMRDHQGSPSGGVASDSKTDEFGSSDGRAGSGEASAAGRGEASGNGKLHTRREREELDAEERIAEEDTAASEGAERLLAHLGQVEETETDILGLNGPQVAETDESSQMSVNGAGVNVREVGEDVKGKMRQEVKERWKPVPPPVTGEPIPVAQPDLDSPPWTSKVGS